MTAEERANEVMSAWGALPGTHLNLRSIIEGAISRAIDDGISHGRQEAMTSFRLPGVPMPPWTLTRLEDAVKQNLSVQDRGTDFLVPRETLEALVRVFDHVRYLQGPILDALGHGELDQYTAGHKAGYEEGKKVREVWMARHEVYGEVYWSTAFHTKDQAVKAVKERARREEHHIDQWEMIETATYGQSWETEGMEYRVYKMAVHDE